MYIVLEGIDGAGKSTQIKMLKEWLESNGLRVETIVEPTDMEVGKLIRKLLTRSDATSDTMQKTLGLLFAADRLILMDKIEQLEKDNIVVISDRSFYSSLSYQDPQDWIKEINKFAKIPDLVSNDNFKIIDANNGPNKVSSDIKKAVAPLFDICKDCIL